MQHEPGCTNADDRRDENPVPVRDRSSVADERRRAAGIRPISSLRLAQRRLDAASRRRLDAPARKADLARVILEMRGALREQHGEAVARSTQRHEHGCCDRRRREMLAHGRVDSAGSVAHAEQRAGRWPRVRAAARRSAHAARAMRGALVDRPSATAAVDL